jgi:hypothetical protein
MAGDAGAFGFGSDLTPVLAAEFLRHGVWRKTRVLGAIAHESSDGFRSNGIEAVAPLLDEDDLPVLRQLVESLVDGYSEAIQPATAAWARRLAELGRPEEAIAAAAWLPRNHRHRAIVRVWTLAELIPILPEPLARTALADLVDTVDRIGERPSFELCQLTKRVPLALAESLWPSDENPQVWLLHALGVNDFAYPFLWDQGSLVQTEFIPGWPRTSGGWAVDGRGFVAAARWLDDDQRYPVLATALLDIGDFPDDDSFMHRAEMLPKLHYDGLLSVPMPAIAAEVARNVLERVSGSHRPTCLLMLAPMLTGDLRERCVDTALASVHDLARVHINEVCLIVPAIVEAGLVDRLLDTIEWGEINDFYWWFYYLAPHLDRAATERALEIVQTDPTRGYRARRFVLPQLASFGQAEATRALELLHEADVPATTLARVRENLAEPDIEPNGRAAYRTPWWEHCTYPGVDLVRPSGVDCYPATVDAPIDTGDEALDLAYRFLADPTDISLLEAALAAEPTLDPWRGLTLVAALTHLPERKWTDGVLVRLEKLRGSSQYTVKNGFPEDAPWLVHGFNEWMPFFVRMLAPDASAAVKPVLFDGGYLDGVLKQHTAFGETQDRLDDWAYQVLTLTPILTVDELEELFSRHDEVKSESTRKAFRGGVATALAGHGQTARAYAIARDLTWQTELIRFSVTRDILPQLPTAAVPEWIAHVHGTFGDPDERAPLWETLNDRWLELDRAQLWEAVETWCDPPGRSRDGVYRDALAYRYAVAQLGGPAELLRLRDLLLG